jgi:hypothetical protein
MLLDAHALRLHLVKFQYSETFSLMGNLGDLALEHEKPDTEGNNQPVAGMSAFCRFMVKN